MGDYISISQLNDFIFCPYSIYLHNVYVGTDESLYHASPQIKGKIAHETVDQKTSSSKKTEIQSLCVCSDELGIMGKIDIYRSDEKRLIERKYKLRKIFKGQVYQLWAQYFCMLEMGYEVKYLSFYEISTNKSYPIDLPDVKGKVELQGFIEQFRSYDPNNVIIINTNKCTHCIYCNMCDKTDTENVYK